MFSHTLNVPLTLFSIPIHLNLEGSAKFCIFQEAFPNMLETESLLLCTLRSHHFMANRWGEMETVADFIFLGSKITVYSDCSRKIKRRFAPWGRAESDMTERLHFHFSLSCTGEGNGNPLQYSCLENPRDGSLVGCHLWGRTESDMTDMT